MNKMFNYLNTLLLPVSKLVYQFGVFLTQEDRKGRIKQLKKKEGRGFRISPFKKIIYYINIFLFGKRFPLKEQMLFMKMLEEGYMYSTPPELMLEIAYQKETMDIRINEGYYWLYKKVYDTSIQDAIMQSKLLEDRYAQLILNAFDNSSNLTVYRLIQEDIEMRIKRSQSLRKSLTMPILTILVIIVAYYGMAIFLLPDFASNFGEDYQNEDMMKIIENGQKLTSNFALFLTEWVLIAIGVVIFIKTTLYKVLADILVMYIPGIGKIVKDVQISNFVSSYMLMIKTGSGNREAIDASLGVVSNTLVRKSLEVEYEENMYNVNLSDLLKNCPYVDNKFLLDLDTAYKSSSNPESIIELIVKNFTERINNILSSPAAIAGPLSLMALSVMVVTVLLPVLTALLSAFDYTTL